MVDSPKGRVPPRLLNGPDQHLANITSQESEWERAYEGIAEAPVSRSIEKTLADVVKHYGRFLSLGRVIGISRISWDA